MYKILTNIPKIEEEKKMNKEDLKLMKDIILSYKSSSEYTPKMEETLKQIEKELTNNENGF